MAYHYCRKPELFSVMDYHAQDHILSNRVLTGGRFVKKHYLGVGDEGARKGHTFLHTA